MDDITTLVSRGECSRGSSSVTSPLGDHNAVVDELISAGLSNKLRIDDVNSWDNANHMQLVKGNYIEEDEEEEDDEDDFSEEALMEQMGYVTKEPQSRYHDDDEEEEEEDEDLSEGSILAQMGYFKHEPPKHEPITTPTAELNLVSALKGGSRSKEGCRVSWDPDVYDPPPTSDDHYTENKNDRHRVEYKVRGAAGKNRQKIGGKGVLVVGGPGEIGGGGSKGGGKGGGKEKGGKGKDKKKVDKKQNKKRGGGASKHGNFGED